MTISLHDRFEQTKLNKNQKIIMKNFLLIAIAAFIMSSCNRAELDQLKHDNDSLTTVVNERELSINDFITSFNEVESNLDSVAAKQQIIAVNSESPGELKATQKSRINAEIASINNLMDQNRKTIAELNRKIKKSSTKNVQLEKMIATLNEQLVTKDRELTELNVRLSSLDAQVAQLEISVDTLIERNSVQSQTIADETAALHTAYYVIGKSDELQDARIIDRKGGLLGIGKTSKLSGDFDNNKFTRIDYTQISSISVNSEMKIITSHPSNSYTLEKDGTHEDRVKNLVITNPEIFWSASKYLVIVKD
jgi:uncharacterized coiled-coil protein SlyX